jgi:hypothetical protein
MFIPLKINYLEKNLFGRPNFGSTIIKTQSCFSKIEINYLLDAVF